MNCPIMMSLGIYVLGAADAAEQRQLEAHIPGCPECQAELSRLAPLPALLAAIPEDVRDTAPRPERLTRRPGRRPAGADARRRSRAGAGWRWAAVAAAVAAGGVSGGVWLASGAGGHPAAPLVLSGTDPAADVSATATLTATSWGTSIQLQVSGVPENVECRLVVRSLNGRTEVSGAWDAWQQGPLNIPASASWLPSDIASLQVTTTAKTLLTISVHPPAGDDR
jgi:anti-sigma-K factor RskA